MAKKKTAKAKSVNDRVAEHRKRKAESGYRQIAVQLPQATVRKLDKLCKSASQSRAVVLQELIKNGSSPAPITVDGVKARDESDNIHTKVRRFKKLNVLEDMTAKQREEFQKLTFQIALVATDSVFE